MSVCNIPSSLHLADSVLCFPLLDFLSAHVLRISCPCGCLTLFILVSVWGSRLSLAAGCCCLYGSCLFPSEQQMKILVDTEGWHRRVIGLRAGNPGATVPHGRLPRVGNWLLLLPLLLLLACLLLTDECLSQSLFFSFILAVSFLLISTTVKFAELKFEMVLLHVFLHSAWRFEEADAMWEIRLVKMMSKGNISILSRSHSMWKLCLGMERYHLASF